MKKHHNKFVCDIPRGSSNKPIAKTQKHVIIKPEM
jgi:hypothetical protein